MAPTILAKGKKTPPWLIVAITVDQMRPTTSPATSMDSARMGSSALRTGIPRVGPPLQLRPHLHGPRTRQHRHGHHTAVHGIIGNNRYSRAEGRKVYCAEDAEAVAVGMPGTDPGKKGQMSPGRMHASTWADELKLHFSRPDGRAPIVIGASMKDRGAILPAGHAADAAYWLNKGDFITSNHYLETLPDWVQEFNTSDVLESKLDGGPSGCTRNLYVSSG